MWQWLTQQWNKAWALFVRPEPSRAQELLADFSRVPRRYRLTGKLGEGGFGLVQSCFDPILNRRTAHKSLQPEYQKDEVQVRSLINEVRLVCYLNHPGVPAIFDAHIGKENEFFYTMELLSGTSLHAYLRKIERQGEYISLARCLRILTKICQTMAYVHTMGVLHLDLTSENVMLGEFGELHILDWGNAHLFAPKRYQEYLARNGKHVDLSELVNRSVQVVGTPPYMSPEQTRQPRHKLTQSADVFSVGIILYRMLTGIYPFSLLSLDEFLRELHETEPEPLHFHRGDVPLRLSHICSKMMAKEASQRYSNFHEVLADLQSLTDIGREFERRYYQAGEIIVEEGDTGEYAFQILDGQVEVFNIVNGQENILTTIGPGEMIGELTIFSKMPRIVTARAKTPTTVYAISESEVIGELEKLTPWVGKMVHSLSRRFLEQFEHTQDSSITHESQEDIQAAQKLAAVIQDRWDPTRKSKPPKD